MPVSHVADWYEYQISDYEDDDCEVQDKNRVRKHAIDVAFLHLRSLTFELRRDRQRNPRPAQRKIAPARCAGLGF